MKEWNGYKNGINLGGWLSQCSEYTEKHYSSFIVKNDFNIIAENGYDHVRLPIDYDLIMTNDGNMIPEGFRHIDNAICWAKENNLNLIIDLHKTIGYSFDDGENENGLFNNEKLQEYFYTIWDNIASRYASLYPRVAFELLNEVTEKRFNDTWMKIAKHAVNIIRSYSTDVKILLGGYFNNSIVAVKDIAMPFDQNIIYNFHCYEPLGFTHNGAYWIPWMPSDFRLEYPMAKDAYMDAIKDFPQDAHIADSFLPEGGLSEQFFLNCFQEAVSIAEKRNVMLYCGEYGVISYTDPAYKKAWLNDINHAFELCNIGHAVWTYREMDFGLFK